MMNSFQKEINMLQTLSIKANDLEHFREVLPISGLFDISDCSIEIICEATSDTEDLAKIISLLEGAINVTDIRITSDIETQGYEILITEVSAI